MTIPDMTYPERNQGLLRFIRWPSVSDGGRVGLGRVRRRYDAIASELRGYFSARPGLTLSLFFWLTIFVVDFLNDWLLAGLSRPLRPWYSVLRDVTLWWVTWLPFTPLALSLARRWSYTGKNWVRNVVRHLLVSSAVVVLHLVVVAGAFTLMYPSGAGVTTRVAQWLGAFTLPEFLVYWGLVGLTWVFIVPRANQPSSSENGRSRRAVAHFSVRDNSRIRLVPVDRVDWLEAEGNYVRLHVGEDEYLVRTSLANTLNHLDSERFKRIHRSTVVNVSRIREIHPWFSGDYVATLQDGRQLKISRTYRHRFLAPML